MLTPDVSEIVWLSDSTVLYINSTGSAIEGGVELWVADVSGKTKRWVSCSAVGGYNIFADYYYPPLATERLLYQLLWET